MDLRQWLASIYKTDPKLGTGPSALGRPAPGPVLPTAAGEGIRNMWSGALRPGGLVGELFNRDTFPALTNKKSPFPAPVPVPVPVPGRPYQPPAGIGGGGRGGGGGGGGGGKPEGPLAPNILSPNDPMYGQPADIQRMIEQMRLLRGMGPSYDIGGGKNS